MFLLINKPPGITSHDVIDRLRKITGIKKIGHAGTLDPFATGLLIVAVGRESTREINKFVKLDKEYLATIKLGKETDTYDKTGKQVKKQIWDMRYGIWSAIRKLLKYQIISHISYLIFGNKKPPSLNQVQSILDRFLGPQLQTPPMYSAKKIGGKKLYQLARQGKEVERKPAKINIYELKVLNYKYPLLKIMVKCSSGTYIRSLAHDIGQKLEIGGYLEELQRTKIGKYKLEDAVDLDKVKHENWKEYAGEI